MQHLRYDSAGRLGRVERTQQGGARVPASLTRSGIFTYQNPDGSTRREYRPPSEVFRSDSLATLSSAPVTEGHVWVTPKNWREVSLGHVADGSVRRDGNLVSAELVIQDEDALERVDCGELCEISLGYRLDYDSTPGVTPDGERYDGVQKNVQINHVALLPLGGARAGREAALRLDSNDDVAIEVEDDEREDDERADGESSTSAYHRMVEQVRNAWRTAPSGRRADHQDEEIIRTERAAFELGGDHGGGETFDARARMIERNRNAWRTKPATGGAAALPPATYDRSSGTITFRR
jgi:hypothetical protein